MSKPNKDGYWLEIEELYQDEDASYPDGAVVFSVFIPVLPMEALLNLVKLAMHLNEQSQGKMMDADTIDRIIENSKSQKEAE